MTKSKLNYFIDTRIQSIGNTLRENKNEASNDFLNQVKNYLVITGLTTKNAYKRIDRNTLFKLAKAIDKTWYLVHFELCDDLSSNEEISLNTWLNESLDNYIVSDLLIP